MTPVQWEFLYKFLGLFLGFILGYCSLSLYNSYKEKFKECKEFADKLDDKKFKEYVKVHGYRKQF